MLRTDILNFPGLSRRLLRGIHDSTANMRNSIINQGQSDGRVDFDPLMEAF